MSKPPPMRVPPHPHAPGPVLLRTGACDGHTEGQTARCEDKDGKGKTMRPYPAVLRWRPTREGSAPTDSITGRWTPIRGHLSGQGHNRVRVWVRTVILSVKVTDEQGGGRYLLPGWSTPVDIGLVTL